MDSSVCFNCAHRKRDHVLCIDLFPPTCYLHVPDSVYCLSISVHVYPAAVFVYWWTFLRDLGHRTNFFWAMIVFLLHMGGRVKGRAVGNSHASLFTFDIF